MRALGALGGQTTADRHGHDHMSAIGAAGARETIRRYGRRYLAELGRQHRLAHPTNLERTVQAALEALGLHENVHYEREGYLFPKSARHHYTGDFVFRRGRLCLQADGDRCPQGANHSRLIGCRKELDDRLDDWLRDLRWTVVRLPESLITGPSAALRCRLIVALAGVADTITNEAAHAALQ